jgi:hypothetical protein
LGADLAAFPQASTIHFTVSLRDINLLTHKAKTMAEHPNGLWIWVLSDIRSDYLEKLVERKVKRIYLKVFDGRSKPMFWGFQCSTDIIQKFRSRGIEVYGWGYHYGTDDITAQVTSVKQALDCGLTGYVLDLESEVEDHKTHTSLKQLLQTLRPLVQGKLGYTSFGHPGFHPDVPWKMLDSVCDLALPQIYFEKFRFGATNADEVQQCLEAHKTLGLTKPILPIWCSEGGGNAAPMAELQTYLNRFPGSSLWRVPRVGDRGEAWNLLYSGQTDPGHEEDLKLPLLKRILKYGSLGDDVAALQRVLNAQGFNAGDVDGEFGDRTQKAVRAFQHKAGITVDGEVGAETWTALGGKADIKKPEQGLSEKLAILAQIEADRHLGWTSPDSEAEKYLSLFREPMRRLGQIGDKKILFDWCGAFVYYCCQQTGIDVPIQPEGFWATMALVESWKYWAKKRGYWYPKGSIDPKPGDILVFDWDGDGELNHIGIVRGYTPGADIIRTSEGNRGNVSGNFTRSISSVAGFIRILK